MQAHYYPEKYPYIHPEYLDKNPIAVYPEGEKDYRLDYSGQTSGERI